MKRVAATGLVLLLLLFLMPFAFLRDDPLAAPAPSQTPAATLPSAPTAAPAARGDAAVTLRVKMPDGTVGEMTMDKYLRRVVEAEMPASFEPAALEAQAVAARTYAKVKMAQTVENHPDADLCTDINCCQAYLEPEAAAAAWGAQADAYTQKIAAAVEQTNGQILTYGGEPIQAVFFSSAVGRTVPAEEVWGNAVPYLTGVQSPEGEEVPNYHSTMSLSPDGFRAILSAQVPQAVLEGDPAGWFTDVVSNSAGGVEELKIGGVPVTGMAVRNLLGLRSTNFTVAATAERITFSVTGYGHGVGMSQYGANAMAKQGKTAAEILKHYYTGVEMTAAEN